MLQLHNTLQSYDTQAYFKSPVESYGTYRYFKSPPNLIAMQIIHFRSVAIKHFQPNAFLTRNIAVNLFFFVWNRSPQHDQQKVNQAILQLLDFFSTCQYCRVAKQFFFEKPKFQRWKPRGRHWPRGHILKSLALASKPQVPGLGLEALGPRKLPSPRLEDSTIFSTLEILLENARNLAKNLRTPFLFSSLGA